MFLLSEIRKNEKMNQQTLADKMGVSRSTVAMWETEASQPDNDALKHLAEIFNVTTDYLLGREDVKNYNQLPSDIVDEQTQELYEKRKLLFDKSAKATPEDMDYIINLVDRLTNNE